MTTSLIKSSTRNSIVEGLYNELVNRNSRYFYFLGKALDWDDPENPPLPVDDFSYELKTRNEIILVKEITPTDVAFVVPRINWTINTVYDQYDDRCSTEVIGVDLIASGAGYGTPPTIEFVGGGGTGAQAEAVTLEGNIIAINMISNGKGYTTTPTVNIIPTSGGTGGFAEAVIGVSANNKTKIEEALFYVVTDEFNVYKCLDNNDGAFSTEKPIGTQPDPVLYADGYVWKFIYNIPIALRNKFFTGQYMPVTTALKNQFYSNGEISRAIIDATGKDYTYAYLQVEGDGYLEKDPLYLSQYTLATGGSGYTTPEVQITLPFSNVVGWTASTLVTINQKIMHDYNIYVVTLGGTTSTVGPVHSSGTVINGTCALRYIGRAANATAVVTGGVVTDLLFDGLLRDFNIIEFGSGYTYPPPVTITGTGTGASAHTIVQNGAIKKIIIDSVGKGYNTPPTVTIGNAWQASQAVTNGYQLYHGSNLYTVTVGGTLSATTPPTHTSGTVANGTAQLAYAGVRALASANIKFGEGYSTVPDVVIAGGTFGSGATAYMGALKSEAQLYPTIENGQITGVEIEDGGIGYSFANISVIGDGTEAQISADLSIGDINSQQSNVELLTVDGRISSIQVVSGGYGYGVCSVVITGDGTGAAATAVVANGRVVKINITNYGEGYRYANVALVGNGYGAVARAVIGPWGGHGKFAIDDLYSRSLMFYSNVSGETIQGFNVDNEYRQFGIIKNPKSFDNLTNLRSLVSTACWVVGGTINTALFTPDMNIRKASNNALFRIVSVTPVSMLIQSIENSTIDIGDVLVNPSNQSFTVTSYTAPTMDKYSGDLLFIDNRAAFEPSTDQKIVLRTILKF